MSNDNLMNLGLFLAEAATVSIVLLFFFRLRELFGMSPLYVTLGAFLYLQTVLANLFPVEIYPGGAISAGSAVLFPANLLIVLLLFVTRRAVDLKRLGWVLVGVHLLLGALIYLLSLHPVSEAKARVFESLFSPNVSCLLFASAIIMVVDIIAVMWTYLAFAGRPLQIRLSMALMFPLILDSFLYAGGRSIILSEPFQLPLLTHVAAKIGASCFYGLMLWIYLTWIEPDTHEHETGYVGVWSFIRYIALGRYADLRPQLVVNPTTKLPLNLKEVLVFSLEEAKRSGTPVSLVLAKIPGIFQLPGDQFQKVCRQLKELRSGEPGAVYEFDVKQDIVGFILRTENVDSFKTRLLHELGGNYSIAVGSGYYDPSPKGGTRRTFLSDHLIQAALEKMNRNERERLDSSTESLPRVNHSGSPSPTSGLHQTATATAAAILESPVEDDATTPSWYLDFVETRNFAYQELSNGDLNQYVGNYVGYHNKKRVAVDGNPTKLRNQIAALEQCPIESVFLLYIQP